MKSWAKPTGRLSLSRTALCLSLSTGALRISEPWGPAKTVAKLLHQRSHLEASTKTADPSVSTAMSHMKGSLMSPRFHLKLPGIGTHIAPNGRFVSLAISTFLGQWLATPLAKMPQPEWRDQRIYIAAVCRDIRSVWNSSDENLPGVEVDTFTTGPASLRYDLDLA